MKILSISIDEEALQQLNALQDRLGFRSRSKLLRSALQDLMDDYGRLDALRGDVESVFLITYNESEKNHVSNLLHQYESYINTELHQHSRGICFDILNVHTSAEHTRKLFGTLKKNKCVYSVTYMIIRSSG